MQPLISPVDHESRRNSHSVDVVVVATEDTPLLTASEGRPERDVRTIVSVGLLILVLIFGAIIGIYLLVLQNEAENILPPDMVSLNLVRREAWDGSTSGAVVPFKAKQIVIEETNTTQCLDMRSCIDLLNIMRNYQNGLPYNFLVSSTGLVFEGVGWRRPPTIYNDTPTLVIALIGNFTRVVPTPEQIEATSNFITLTENQGYVESNYVIVLKNNTQYSSLYQTLKRTSNLN